MTISIELTVIAVWQQWAGLIIDAEKPAALSSRDGRLLRRPPMPAKLERHKLVQALQQALTDGLQQHARDLLVEAQGGLLPAPLTCHQLVNGIAIKDHSAGLCACAFHARPGCTLHSWLWPVICSESHRLHNSPMIRRP